MKKEYSQTCFQKMKTYKLFENYSIKVEIDENPYKIDADSLFVMAARKNRKRGFLFVSKVLGKHIPVIPGISILTGMLIGIEYYRKISGEKHILSDRIVNLINKYSKNDIQESMFNNSLSGDFIGEMGIKSKALYNEAMQNKIHLSEKTLFIGFAETATALGNSVFEIFQGDIGYIHTTREYLVELQTSIAFEEEHSHATEHFIYSDISKYDKIVFIDDEITTGKTICNFIKKIREKTEIEKFAVLSILDWRNNDNYERLMMETGIVIEPVSLIRGKIEQIGVPEHETIFQIDKNNWDNTINTEANLFYLDKNKMNLVNYTSFNSKREINCSPYIKESGRFIINENSHFDYEYVTEFIENLINKEDQTKPVLFLGTGEFMYIPMKIAINFPNAVYHSTTRSPIFIENRENYGAKNGIEFKNPYDSDMKNYLYNIKRDIYSKIIIFFERDAISSDFSDLIGQMAQFQIFEIDILVFVKY